MYECLPACKCAMCMHMDTKEGVGSPGAGVYTWLCTAIRVRVLGTEPGCLQEQPVLLATKPSL